MTDNAISLPALHVFNGRIGPCSDGYLTYYTHAVKQIRERDDTIKELREAIDALLDSLRDESLPDWASRKIYEFETALSKQEAK